MLIDLKHPRKFYFTDWTAREILLDLCSKTGLPARAKFTADDLLDMPTSTATSQNDLEALLGGEAYDVNPEETVAKIKSLKSDQLLVLPPSYRIPAGDSRKLIAYRYNSLIFLHPRSGKSAEEVCETAFSMARRQKDKHLARPLIGYAWKGQDDLLRVVSFMNAVEGQELRAFQNLAWYKLGLPEVPQTTSSKKKMKRYISHLQSRRPEGGILQDYVERLEVRQRDMIRFSHEWKRIMHFQVPSRGDIYGEYNVKVCNVPFKASDVWRMYAECYCPDSSYRSDRRDSKKEFYYCPHSIAALQGLRARQQYFGQEERVDMLPFLIPTKSMIDFVDKLRYRSVMVEQSPETGNWKIRALNQTEIGSLAMMKMVTEPYEKNATTDPDVFRARKYDPMMDLVKFRK